jgi:hypothetical protein
MEAYRLVGRPAAVAANCVFSLHLGYCGFLAFGWIAHGPVEIAYILSLGFELTLLLCGAACPLTTLEWRLRQAEGQDLNLSDPYLSYYGARCFSTFGISFSGSTRGFMRVVMVIWLAGLLCIQLGSF